MWVKVSVYLGSRTLPVVLEPASFLENNSVSWGFDVKEKERGEKERAIFRLFFIKKQVSSAKSPGSCCFVSLL